MATVDSLINEAEDSKALKRAQQDGTIEYNRILVLKSLPKDVWDTFGITEKTERTRINTMDHPQLASYILEGAAEFSVKGKNINVPFDFEVSIGNDALPNVIFAYVSSGSGRDSHMPKGWSSPPPKRLITIRDIHQPIEDVHAENKKMISDLLLEVKNGLSLWIRE